LSCLASIGSRIRLDAREEIKEMKGRRKRKERKKEKENEIEAGRGKEKKRFKK
jgi:hypothetical protein